MPDMCVLNHPCYSMLSKPGATRHIHNTQVLASPENVEPLRALFPETVTIHDVSKLNLAVQLGDRPNLGG